MPTRLELITSDEWVTARLEVIVTSGKGVKKIRKEIAEYWLAHKNELISYIDKSKATTKTLKL